MALRLLCILIGRRVSPSRLVCAQVGVLSQDRIKHTTIEQGHFAIRMLCVA